jgi:hypothetical protein
MTRRSASHRFALSLVLLAGCGLSVANNHARAFGSHQ